MIVVPSHKQESAASKNAQSVQHLRRGIMRQLAMDRQPDTGIQLGIPSCSTAAGTACHLRNWFSQDASPNTLAENLSSVSDTTPPMGQGWLNCIVIALWCSAGKLEQAAQLNRWHYNTRQLLTCGLESNGNSYQEPDVEMQSCCHHGRATRKQCPLPGHVWSCH